MNMTIKEKAIAAYKNKELSDKAAYLVFLQSKSKELGDRLGINIVGEYVFIEGVKFRVGIHFGRFGDPACLYPVNQNKQDYWQNSIYDLVDLGKYFLNNSL